MRYFTRNGTDRCQNGSSNPLTSYREQPQSTRFVAPYPRPAFSTTRRTNYVPINFNQQAKVCQGHTLCRNKENCNTEIHGGGGLELVKSARESASSRPKFCVSLKNAPEVLPVRRSFLNLIRRKQIVIIDQLSPQKPPGSRLSFSSTRVQHFPG